MGERLIKIDINDLLGESKTNPILHCPPVSSHPVYSSLKTSPSFLSPHFHPWGISGAALSNASNYTHRLFTESEGNMGAESGRAMPLFTYFSSFLCLLPPLPEQQQLNENLHAEMKGSSPQMSASDWHSAEFVVCEVTAAGVIISTRCPGFQTLCRK